MNHQKQRLLIFFLPALLAFVSLGCGLSNGLTKNDPTPTRTAMPTFTPTVAGQAFVDVNIADAQAQAQQEQAAVQEPPTATPEPPPTEVPTQPPPPTDTPAPQAPSVTILQDMNVRGGPGTNYPVVGPAPAGESAKILGRNSDNSWVQVEYPAGNNGLGWVYTELVQINGDLSGIEVASAPPPPAPVAQAPAPEPAPEEPKEEAPPPPPPEPKYPFTPTGWFASENAGITQFKGRLRDEGGNLVNGFSILASNGSFSVLSRPAGSNPWFPDVGPGEWDVVLPNMHTAQGWWWLTVVIYECNFWGGFDAQCTSFTRLSEDVKVQIASPAESIINADWVCHWDCNKGLYVSCLNDRGKVTCQ